MRWRPNVCYWDSNCEWKLNDQTKLGEGNEGKEGTIQPIKGDASRSGKIKKTLGRPSVELLLADFN
jgi:hypothetical protein